MKRVIEDVSELETMIREIISDKKKLKDIYASTCSENIDYLIGEIDAYYNALHLIDLFAKRKE